MSVSRPSGKLGNVVMGYPVVVAMSGLKRGVIDLGERPPVEVAVQADLRTNSGSRVSLLPSEASADDIGSLYVDGVGGGDFDNQPAGDGIEVVGGEVTDTRIVTIYGTDANGDIVSEAVTLDGTTPVETVRQDWALCLGLEVNIADALSFITVSEASGHQAIGGISENTTSTGVYRPAALGYGLPVSIVAGGASTKYVGIVGKNGMGLYQSEVLQLNGTTDVPGSKSWKSVTMILTGDVAAASTVDVAVGDLVPSVAACTLTDMGVWDDAPGRRLPGHYRYIHWALYTASAEETGGAADFLQLIPWY